MLGGGYSPWEWMTGVPLVNVAGQAAGRGQDNSQSNRGPKMFDFGTTDYTLNTPSGQKVPVTPQNERDILKRGNEITKKNKAVDMTGLEKETGTGWWGSEGPTLRTMLEGFDGQDVGGSTYMQADDPNANSYTTPYVRKYSGGTPLSPRERSKKPGDGLWPNDPGAKRDPFQPLPGMKHNPDPKADPFKGGGKMQGFTDPHADALLGLIRGYDQLRSQGATREMALTTLHYQPPQQMAMGGGGTGTGGGQQGSGGSGDAFPQYGDQPNSDDWGSSKPYTEWTGIPIINPFNDQDLPITGKGPKIFPEEHLYPQQDLQRQYYSDREKLLGGTEQQRFDAEGSLRNKREQFQDATKQGQTTVQKSLRKSQRDEKLNDRRVQVDTGGK